MDYSEVFLRQHDEMCQVVGSIVFSLVEAGHDSTSENIVAVLRNGIAEIGKWEPDQILYLQLAIDLLERGRGVPGAHCRPETVAISPEVHQEEQHQKMADIGNVEEMSWHEARAAFRTQMNAQGQGHQGKNECGKSGEQQRVCRQTQQVR